MTNRSTGLIRIVTLVLAVAVLGAGATSVVGSFFVRQSTRTTVFTAPVHRLAVTTYTGNLVIRAAAAGEETMVISKGRSAFRRAAYNAGVKDGVLTVSGDCLGHSFLADACSMSFEIVVPPGSTVEANSSTGSVIIFGPMSSTHASTDTGDVRVVGTGGSLQLQTDTGDVTGDLLKSGTVSAQSDTGDVTLGFAVSPHRLRAVADTGDVQIRVPDDGSAYRVQASADIGDRFVTVPTTSTSDRSIVASSSTGSVHVLTQRIP
jgi:DUF4097 and DUF4098 domain-containing protein YvlB